MPGDELFWGRCRMIPKMGVCEHFWETAFFRDP